MRYRFDEAQVGALWINNSATASSGITHIYNDSTDNQKLKIGRSNILGNNVAMSIDREGAVSGSFTGSFAGNGSFTGSFAGNGSLLTNVTANINGTSSVNIGEFYFDKSTSVLASKPAIRVKGGNQDPVIFRADNSGLDLGSYGFSVKYMGSRSGNDNSLSFFFR